MFYQDRPIYHCTYVPGPVAQSISDSQYNVACTLGLALAHFRKLNNEFLNKSLDVVPKTLLLIVMDSKSAVCTDNTGKDTKHIRNIFR